MLFWPWLFSGLFVCQAAGWFLSRDGISCHHGIHQLCRCKCFGYRNNISEPLENAFNTVSDIKQVYSTSRDNVSLVTLEFEYGTDLDAAANDIRDALSLYSAYLPEELKIPSFSNSVRIWCRSWCCCHRRRSYAGIKDQLEEKNSKSAQPDRGDRIHKPDGTPTVKLRWMSIRAGWKLIILPLSRSEVYCRQKTWICLREMLKWDRWIIRYVSRASSRKVTR